jgi:hypothetical protein
MKTIFWQCNQHPGCSWVGKGHSLPGKQRSNSLMVSTSGSLQEKVVVLLNPLPYPMVPAVPNMGGFANGSVSGEFTIENSRLNVKI